MALRQKMKSRRSPVVGIHGKYGKLARCYAHSRGFSKFSDRLSQIKDRNYIRNRVLLFILAVILLIPGIYYSFR